MTSKTYCFVSALFYPHHGGVERYTHQLSKKLVELGHKVYVLTTNSENVNSHEVIDGIFVYRLPVFRKAGSRYPVLKPGNCYSTILQEIRNLRFDYFVINTRFYLTTLLGLKLAKEKKTPAIVIEHGTGHFTVNNRILDFFGRIYERYITDCVKRYNPLFFGVSKACNEWLKRFNIKSSGVLYNGIDAHYVIKDGTDFKNKFNIPHNSTVITFAGRLIKEKGVLDLFEAAKKLVVQYPDIYFFIAGSGPLLHHLENNDNYCKNIFILGKLEYDSLMSLLSQSDILVNPSKYPEGLPTIILEAGFNKCAVIATDQGGTTEVIVNSKYGMIIRSGMPQDIVKAVIYLKEARAEMALVSHNIHEKIKTEFDWNTLANNFLNITA